MNKNLASHPSTVNALQRAAQKGQKPFVLWLTGLSGAGKSTIANAVESALVERGQHTYLLDGDNVRTGLCGDLGFTEGDRQENIRRISEVSKLFLEAGLIVITAFISPSLQDRSMARKIIGKDRFVEVFIDTPLDECERRDPKGLYVKARQGLIKNFTGIGAAYERPTSPQVRINTMSESLESSVSNILEYIDGRSF